MSILVITHHLLSDVFLFVIHSLHFPADHFVHVILEKQRRLSVKLKKNP